LDLETNEVKDVEWCDGTIHTRSFLQVLQRWCLHQKLDFRIFIGYAKEAVYIVAWYCFVRKRFLARVSMMTRRLTSRGLTKLVAADK
jgi:hypothetical protein